MEEIFVDFVNSKPTSEEESAYNKAEEYLAESESLLETLKKYKGMV